MTRVISLRVPVRKLAVVDRRAADVGLGRTGYLMRLVDNDLDNHSPPPKRRAFNSRHLLGRFKSSGSTNPKVRAALKAAANEKDR